MIRVELGPGDLFGADYAGKSQVLNIILSAEVGFDDGGVFAHDLGRPFRQRAAAHLAQAQRLRDRGEEEAGIADRVERDELNIVKMIDVHVVRA